MDSSSTAQKGLASDQVLCSPYFSEAYRCRDMACIFSHRQKISRWLVIESALARAQARLGAIPADAARVIAANASVDKVDFDRLLTIRHETGHTLIPVIKALGELCGSEVSRYVHFGATTQDIQDTEQSLALKEAYALIEAKLDRLRKQLGDLAHSHQGTVCAGRTHFRPAAPITFGFKAGSWLDELNRNIQRLHQVRERTTVLQMYGGVGSAAAFGVDPEALEKDLAEQLELRRADYPWHAARDRIVESLYLFSIISSGLSRIAFEITELSRPEIGEISFLWPEGLRCSSTMPHKRNPEECEQVITLAHLVQGHFTGYLGAPESIHERDFRNVRMEWVVLPECAVYLSRALSLLSSALELMVVHPAKMKANADKCAVELCSERLMFELGKKLGKDRAFDILSEIFEACAAPGRDPIQLMAAHAEVAQHFHRDEIAAMLNPRENIGHCRALTQRILGKS